jgi:hypothetical protein
VLLTPDVLRYRHSVRTNGLVTREVWRPICCRNGIVLLRIKAQGRVCLAHLCTGPPHPSTPTSLSSILPTSKDPSTVFSLLLSLHSPHIPWLIENNTTARITARVRLHTLVSRAIVLWVWVPVYICMYICVWWTEIGMSI